jgi:hypothetical protein
VDSDENNEVDTDEQELMQAMELDFVNGRQLSLSTPTERYCAMQICNSEVQEMGRHFSLNAEDAAFYVHTMQTALKTCRERMMQKQGMSYETAEGGAILDPLTLRSNARSSNRTKRRDELYSHHSSSGAKRRSFFRPSVDVHETDVEYEAILKPKGRPRKQV